MEFLDEEAKKSAATAPADPGPVAEPKPRARRTSKLSRSLTFVEQVRRHGADPFAYFEWVFEKLMHHPPADHLPVVIKVIPADKARDTPP